MSYTQPGPYGGPPQPPQQPYPYGQGGGPAQPGPYGYPQQPGPYGAFPQQPYGQPGMPPPYPPPAPPQGGGKGKAIAIAAGALVLVGAIVAGGMLLFKGGSHHDSAKKDNGRHQGGTGGSTPAPAGKRYKLTVPDSIPADYHKSTTKQGGGFDSGDMAQIKALGVANAQTVGADYETGQGANMKFLQFKGAWGEVKDPEVVVNGFFEANKAKQTTDDGGKVEFMGSPQKVTPAGMDSDTVMKCQNATYSGTKASRDVVMPLCFWADHSTVGLTILTDASAVISGESTSIEDAAALTAKVRTAARVEIP